MKILIVASWFPDAESPFSGVFIAEQARALAIDHTVTVIAPSILRGGSSRRREVEERDGYRLVRVGLPARNVIHQLDYARAVVAEIRSSECDVVHAHVTLPAGFAAVLAGRWTRRPVVITEHRGPFAALMETPRDRFKVRFALERAEEVIAVSSSLAREMASHGINRAITVVPNVVDTSRFAPAASTHRTGEPFRLLFAGILRDHNKNLPLLLRALGRLLNDGRDYRLTVVGDGEVRGECEEMARTLGVSEQCEFRGALGPDDLSQEMRSADVFVVPSRSETFGIVAAEALCVGRPVIATRCGGPEDFITEEVGVLVPVEDEEALAAAIAEVCTRLEDLPAPRLSAYAQGKFGQKAVTSRLTEIYERVTQRGTQASRAALLI